MSEKVVAIVEDPFVIEAGIADKIADAGYTVVVVTRGPDLMSDLIKAKPGIVITDRDPGLDDEHPFGLIEQIQAADELKATEIFFFSDLLDVKTEVALRKLRINSFFLKALEPTAILGGIELHFDPPAEETYDMWEKRKYQEDHPTHTHTQYVQVPTPGVPSADAPPPPPAVGGGSLFDDFANILGFDEGDKAAKSHFDLGKHMFDAAAYDACLNELRMATNSATYAAQAYLMMGIAYRNESKPGDAVRCFKAGFKMAQGDERTDFTYELALTLEGSGKGQEAYRMYAGIYKTDPAYRDVKERLIHLKKSLPALDGA